MLLSFSFLVRGHPTDNVLKTLGIFLRILVNLLNWTAGPV